MPQGYQSIGDLISSPQDKQQDDDSVQAKFAKEEEKIKIKEVERLTERKAGQSGLSYVNLVGFSISQEALPLIEEEEATRLAVVCFFYDGKNLRLATTKPDDEKVKIKLQELEKKYHSAGKLYLISDYSLSHALGLYKLIPKVREFVKGVKITEEELNKYSENFSSFKDLQEQINKIQQVTDIVTIILASAIKSGCSDVHIEGEEKDIKVRFRLDGILHDTAVLDKELWKKIISRFKALAKVKINITDKPQDGRISIFTKEDRIDIRASFLPTAHGESLVMRLLRSSSVGLSFEDLGLRGGAFKKLKRETERPNGMIIATGPTGSGKTTTLYAILKKLNTPETKIITIEDPIEYQLEGVNQSQASEKYRFADALRSIMRQDPDIIMVGEIRDLETAEIAIQAALTGHLVVSTIHTNNAAGTVPRFLSMGAKPFLLTPALNAIIGQRLPRKICKKCKTEDKVDKEKMERVKEILEKLPVEEKKEVVEKYGESFANLKFYKGSGCEACQRIGYKGRIGIYEIMTMNKEIEQLILNKKVSEFEMQDNAVKNGMVTMVQDGLLKALEGITSVEEIFRIAE